MLRNFSDALKCLLEFSFNFFQSRPLESRRFTKEPMLDKIQGTHIFFQHTMQPLPAPPSPATYASLIRAALDEDGAARDVTTLSLVDPAARITADIIARHGCRVAGAMIAEQVFKTLDPALAVEIRIPDGADAAPDDIILTIAGAAGSILSAERVALNFFQRMTGIATATKAYVAAAATVEGSRCKILDTRKTAPGFRVLDKYAVLCGGGANHRMGLSDMALIKDNHRKLWKTADAARLDLAVAAAREKFPGIPVEVEVETFDELASALSASPPPEWIMLDNMPPPLMREAVALIAGRSKVEASGGINASTVCEVASTGVDAISIGALTHSVKAADLSLEIRD